MICDRQTINAHFLPRPFCYISKAGRLNPHWTCVQRSVLENCKTGPRQYAIFKHSMTEEIKLDNMAYLISETEVSCEFLHHYRIYMCPVVYMTYSAKVFQYWGHFILCKTCFILLNNSASRGNLFAILGTYKTQKRMMY